MVLSKKGAAGLLGQRKWVEEKTVVSYAKRCEMLEKPLKLMSCPVSRGLVGASLLLAVGTSVGLAQQTAGAPGSPSATTTIEGNQLPPLPPKFGGKIERNAAQSTPYWPPRVVPPEGAPNVLLIMTDDTGFGVSSTFGGVI